MKDNELINDVSDVVVTQEDLGGLAGGLDGGKVVIIEDFTPEQAMQLIRGNARYVSLCNAVEIATDDPTSDNLDDLAETLTRLIQDDREYKGKETHQLIMKAKLKALFELMAK